MKNLALVLLLAFVGLVCGAVGRAAAWSTIEKRAATFAIEAKMVKADCIRQTHPRWRLNCSGEVESIELASGFRRMKPVAYTCVPEECHWETETH